jgi:hypothetical protein
MPQALVMPEPSFSRLSVLAKDYCLLCRMVSFALKVVLMPALQAVVPAFAASWVLMRKLLENCPSSLTWLFQAH